MKLSKDTTNLLKNFSYINNSIVIKPGRKLRTITPQNSTVFAEALTTENFPQEFGIYDLSEFLGVLSLFEDPNVEFSDRYLTISDNAGYKVKYEYCSPSLISQPPDREIRMTTEETFKLTQHQIGMLMKAAAVLGSPDLLISGEGNVAVVTVKEKKNSSSNQFSIDLPPGSWTENNSKAYQIKLDNLKLIPGDYVLEVSSRAVKFINTQLDSLNYYVSVVPESNKD